MVPPVATLYQFMVAMVVPVVKATRLAELPAQILTTEADGVGAGGGVHVEVPHEILTYPLEPLVAGEPIPLPEPPPPPNEVGLVAGILTEQRLLEKPAPDPPFPAGAPLPVPPIPPGVLQFVPL